MVDDSSQSVYAHLQKMLEKGADHIKGQEKDGQHDQHEQRDRGPLAGQDGVQLAAADVFFALLRLDHSRRTQTADKQKPHVRDGCRPVQAPLRFHLFDDMLDHFFFVLIQL